MATGPAGVGEGERATRRGALASGVAAGLALAFGHYAAFFGHLYVPSLSPWAGGLALFVWCPVVAVAAARARRVPARFGSAIWAMGVGLGMLAWWAVQFAWVTQVSAAGFVPMVLLLAVFPMLTAWLLARTARRFGAVGLLALGPVVITGTAFFRGRIAFTGFPWLLEHHPLIDTPLAMGASLIGGYGLLFLAGVVSAGVGVALAGSRRMGLVFALGAAVIAGGLAVLAPEPQTGAAVRVAVVQTEIPQRTDVPWSIADDVAEARSVIEGMHAAAAEEPDLIVLPEGVSGARSFDRAYLDAVRRAGVAFNADERALGEGLPAQIAADELAEIVYALQSEIGVPVLLNANGYAGFRVERDGGGLSLDYDRVFNRVTLVQDGMPGATYDKLRLTPFGEVMPYISAVPALERALLGIGAAGMAFEFSPGDRATLFEVQAGGGAVPFVAPICYEASLPAATRRMVMNRDGTRRALLLVNPTNDGWFAFSGSGRRMHLLAARWRCVELATPMARAANTGVSAIVDARGRIITAGAVGAPAGGVTVLSHDIELAGSVTLYARTGDWAGWACLGGSLIAAVLVLNRPARAGRG